MSKSWSRYLRKDMVCPHCRQTITNLKEVERVSHQVIKCPHCATELSMKLRYPKLSFALAAGAGLISMAMMFTPENMEIMHTASKFAGGALVVAFVFSTMQLKFASQ